MLLHILAVGDVVGEGGQDILSRRLREIQEREDIHFTVVNGENASGVGITPRQARGILEAGADVITLGNHTWNRLQIADFLDSDGHILRPANYAGRVPGRGFGVFRGPAGVRIGVLNLMGRLELNSNLDSPFQAADRLLRGAPCDVVLVDFHAEATSEKGAMAWYLDGRAQAVWGTHTHVPTADCQLLPKGTGFVTDLGMTGPYRSVLGIRPEFLDIVDSGTLEGEIYGAMPTGMESTIKVRIDDFLLTGVIFGSSLFTIGAKVPLSITGDNIMLFDRKSGKCIAQGRLEF